jgi:hypothetical protein
MQSVLVFVADHPKDMAPAAVSQMVLDAINEAALAGTWASVTIMAAPGHERGVKVWLHEVDLASKLAAGRGKRLVGIIEAMRSLHHQGYMDGAERDQVVSACYRELAKL